MKVYFTTKLHSFEFAVLQQDKSSNKAWLKGFEKFMEFLQTLQAMQNDFPLGSLTCRQRLGSK
jgi:DNA-binding transcriptional regulator WhiA